MKTGILRGSVLLAATVLLTACGQKEISYQADVQPILKQYCLECHVEGGDGYAKSGLSMTSHESLMKGTKFGSIVKPGDSLGSVLIQLVEGARRSVDQDAAWQSRDAQGQDRGAQAMGGAGRQEQLTACAVLAHKPAARGLFFARRSAARARPD